MKTPLTTRSKFSATLTSGLLALCLSLLGAATPASAQLYIPISLLPISGIFSHHSSGSRSGAGYACVNEAGRVYNKGVHLERDKNYEQAAECYRQALQINPGMTEAHGALGNALFNQGKFEEALGELESATRLEPRSSSNWFMLGQCCTRLRKADQALTAYQRSLHLDSSGSSASFAKEYIEILQHVAFAQPGSSDFTGSYLDDSGKAKHKWENSCSQLKVYIAADAKVPNFMPEFEQILRDSFQDWSAMSDGKIQFVFVEKPSDAQICCRWTADKNELGGGEELGITATLVNESELIRHADITLLTKFDEDNVRPDDICKRAKVVYLHEIGHALGLNHSNESYDVMFPRVSPLGLEHALTNRDHNSLVALYAGATTNIATTNVAAKNVATTNIPTNIATNVAATNSAPTTLAATTQGHRVAARASAIVSNSPSEGFSRPSSLSHSNIEVIVGALSREASAANDEHDFGLAIERLDAAHKLVPDNQEVTKHLGYAYENAATAAEQGLNYGQALSLNMKAVELLGNGSEAKEAIEAVQRLQQMIKR